VGSAASGGWKKYHVMGVYALQLCYLSNFIKIIFFSLKFFAG
jgi:hypothetical protein